jgi:3',5'-nucleoside bisphosphate phosphatase
VERDEPELVEGVRQIRESGGIPSLAHPVRLPERDRASLEKLLVTLIDNGLQRLDVYHSEHSPEDTALYKELTAQFNLIETWTRSFAGIPRRRNISRCRRSRCSRSFKKRALDPVLVASLS